MPLRATCGLLAALLLASPAAGQGLDPGLRQELAASGAVAPAVLDALAAEGRTRVLVYLGGGREALGARVDGLLGHAPPGGLELRRRFQRLPGFAAVVTPGAVAALVAAGGPELWIYPDARVEAQLAQSVPLIRADRVQQAGLDGSGVRVAMIDTGWDSDHADLAGAAAAEHCFCDGDGLIGTPTGCCPNGFNEDDGSGSAEDDHGHGTRIAGIMSSDGNVAAVGVAPALELVVVKVLNEEGGGFASDSIAGLEWILAQHPEVAAVNVSLGSFDRYPGDCDDDEPLYRDAVDDLRAAGIPTVAASGNNAETDKMIAPACIASAISVGAVWDADLGEQTKFFCTEETSADLPACWSNASTATDLLAPGALIRTPRFDGTAGNFTGTSAASPHVAACLGALRQGFPLWPLDALEERLKATGVPLLDPKNGLSYPRIDCRAAMLPPVPTAGPVGQLLLAALLALAGLRLARR